MSSPFFPTKTQVDSKIPDLYVTYLDEGGQGKTILGRIIGEKKGIIGSMKGNVYYKINRVDGWTEEDIGYDELKALPGLRFVMPGEHREFEGIVVFESGHKLWFENQNEYDKYKMEMTWLMTAPDVPFKEAFGNFVSKWGHAYIPTILRIKIGDREDFLTDYGCEAFIAGEEDASW